MRNHVAETNGSISKCGPSLLGPKGDNELVPSPPQSVPSGVSVLESFDRDQTELLAGALARGDSPEVDGELSGGGHGALLASAFACGRSHRIKGLVVRLPFKKPPDALDKNVAHTRVAVFGHRALAAGLARRVFARTQAGVGGNLTPVFEALPVKDFAADLLDAERAESLGSAAAFPGLAEFLGECVESLLDFQGESSPISDLLGQSSGKVLLNGVPGFGFPPLVWNIDARGEHETAGAFEVALLFLRSGRTLARDKAIHFLFGRGNPDGGKDGGVAFDITVEPHGQRAGIAFVGLHALAARVESLGGDDDVFDAHSFKGAMEVVAEGAGLVAGVELDAGTTRVLDELERLLVGHLERGLRGSVADLAAHGDLGGVDIQTEFDFDDFLGRSLGLLVCWVLFHMQLTGWRRSRRLSATCHLYRERGDAENPFDELKNQWGWAGFTTQDFARCQVTARLIAQIYNWWSLYARLVDREKHREAVTTRPELLGGVARQTRHAGQTRISVNLNHSKGNRIKSQLAEASAFLQGLVASAEQLTHAQRWERILLRIFEKYIAPKLLTAGPPSPAPA